VVASSDFHPFGCSSEDLEGVPEKFLNAYNSQRRPGNKNR
jgi:hypothetical protein